MSGDSAGHQTDYCIFAEDSLIATRPCGFNFSAIGMKRRQVRITQMAKTLLYLNVYWRTGTRAVPEVG
jgi:hypothetical protein